MKAIIIGNTNDTAKEAAEKSPDFIKACKAAGVEPTKRQYSRWRSSKGQAYANRFKNEEK